MFSVCVCIDMPSCVYACVQKAMHLARVRARSRRRGQFSVPFPLLPCPLHSAPPHLLLVLQPVAGPHFIDSDAGGESVGKRAQGAGNADRSGKPRQRRAARARYAAAQSACKSL